MPRWAKVVIWAVVFALWPPRGHGSRRGPIPSRPASRIPARAGRADRDNPSEGLARSGRVVQGGHRASSPCRGTCRSDWRGTYRVRLLEDGSIDGVSGIAALDPGSARCDFDQGQLQAATAELWVGGTWSRKTSGTCSAPVPCGPARSGRLLDVGGFLATIGSVRPELEPIVDLDSYGDDRELNLSDGNQGEYVAAYGFLASCRSGCD